MSRRTTVTSGALAGVSVLLTRPRQQAGELAAAIAAAGGNVVAFPVIEIVPCEADEIRQEASALADPDIVIFISSNAVIHGLAYAHTQAAAIAAIGPATRDAIRAAGCEVDIFSTEQSDSEHLLLEPALQDVADKTIRIIRGSDGRELLATTLRQRGAQVEYLSVYKRLAAQHDDEEVARLDAVWRESGINCAVVMSVDSLRKLLHALPDSCVDRLRKTPLVTPSERVIQTASELLPEAPAQLAGGPACADIMQALANTVKLQ